MSNPLVELRKLLGASSKKETGTVIALTPSIIVSTREGTRTVTSGVAVAIGDCVLISGGVIEGKLRRQEEVPEYYL